jgi:antitoxin CptB
LAQSRSAKAGKWRGFTLYPCIMTDSPEIIRKRLRYRAWHRGTKELDLLLGRFADARLGDMDRTALADFEVLSEVPENVLYRWITGAGALPEHADSATARELLAFCHAELPDLLQDTKA